MSLQNFGGLKHSVRYPGLLYAAGLEPESLRKQKTALPSVAFC